ncbi:MAG: ACP S-malonyltransferase [Myxococcales bacterium]|nr:ACP S-malonyltransferase [Myxococcales bacterium]
MKVAWLFPGQGAQSVGMGHKLFSASTAARAAFERADAALGEPLSKLVFEGPEAELTRTANAQPAIVTTSIAVLEAVKERYPQLPAPSFAAGHSLGEYSALVASGALAFEDAVRLVRARGRAMQEAVREGEGAMAAIMGLEGPALEAICVEAAKATGEVVSCANFNAPGQIVIAGAQKAVAAAQELASAQKGKAIPLKVSAPFHCALMAPAARAVEAELAGIRIGDLAFPVVANVDAEPNVDPSRVKGLLVRQVDGAVRWEQAILRMRDEGVTHALELGPGKVLAGLVKRIAKDIKVLSVGDPESLDAVGAFLG